MKRGKLCLLLCLAVLLAAASWSYAGVLFDDNFDAIPDGETDPAWQPLVGDWVVQGGQYTSGAVAGPWQWSVVDGLTVGDCVVAADMLAINSGILVRLQDPTAGSHPSQFVLLQMDGGGIHVYRDAWGNVANSGWSDGQDHSGEWVHVEVSMIGEDFSSSARVASTAITATIPVMTLAGIYATGSVGLYGFVDMGIKYDNFSVSTPAVTGSVSGTVTAYGSGSPIAGATVTCDTLTTTTDADGKYTLSGLSLGQYTLTVTGVTGYYDKQCSVNVDRELVTQDVALDAVASGSILYQDHFEGGVNLNWMPLVGNWSGLYGRYTNGGPDGPWQWSVVDLSLDDCIVSSDMLIVGSNSTGMVVRTTPDWGVSPLNEFVLLNVDQHGVSIYHNAWSYVAGATYMDRSHPGEWVNANVRVVGSQLSVWIKDDGGAVIAVIPDTTIPDMSATGSVGLYGIAGSGDTYDNFMVTTSDATGNLSGKVTDSRTGLPVAGAVVQLVGTSFSTPTNDTGDYAFTGVSAGGYLLQVDSPDHVQKQVGVAVNAGANVANVQIDPYQKVGEVKKLGAGISLGASGIVTAVFGDRFVIEDEDRAAGISVSPVSPGDLQIGEEVLVAGQIGANGKLAMAGPAIRTGRTGVQIGPVGVNNRGVSGAAGSAGLDNRDLLVDTWGRLLADPLTLADGTVLLHISDGTALAGEETVPAPSAWGLIFEDSFSSIADGDPAPGWLPLVGDWVVQSGQYTCGAGAGPWQWTVVDGLVLGDCSIKADMLALNAGLLVRLQNPAPGTHPSQFVLLHVAGGGITIYRDAWGNQGGAGWNDGFDHSGEWVTVEVRMIGETFSATATATVTGATATIDPRTLSGIYPTGYVGLYGFQNSGDIYDNVRVEGVTSLSVPKNSVQIVVPPSVSLPAYAEGDFVKVTGIAGKGQTLSGSIRGIQIRQASDVTAM